MNDHIRAIVRSEIEKLDKPQAQFAQDLGMSRQYFGDMLRGETSNIPRRWGQVFDALGLELCICPKDIDVNKLGRKE